MRALSSAPRRAAASEVFAGLGGGWCFARSIQDARTGALPCVHATGTAQFAPTAGGPCWMYEEQGKIAVAEQRLGFAQSYRYALDAGGGIIQVYFSRGEHRDRHFHDIQLTGANVEGTAVSGRGDHACGQDVYTADYLFRFYAQTLVSFCITYSAHGPHKNYVSRTDFSRAAARRV